jgi:hypothetical protein
VVGGHRRYRLRRYNERSRSQDSEEDLAFRKTLQPAVSLEHSRTENQSEDVISVCSETTSKEESSCEAPDTVPRHGITEKNRHQRKQRGIFSVGGNRVSKETRRGMKTIRRVRREEHCSPTEGSVGSIETPSDYSSSSQRKKFSAKGSRSKTKAVQYYKAFNAIRMQFDALAELISSELLSREDDVVSE